MAVNAAYKYFVYRLSFGDKPPGEPLRDAVAATFNDLTTVDELLVGADCLRGWYDELFAAAAHALRAGWLNSQASTLSVFKVLTLSGGSEVGGVWHGSATTRDAYIFGDGEDEPYYVVSPRRLDPEFDHLLLMEPQVTAAPPQGK